MFDRLGTRIGDSDEWFPSPCGELRVFDEKTEEEVYEYAESRFRPLAGN